MLDGFGWLDWRLGGHQLELHQLIGCPVSGAPRWVLARAALIGQLVVEGCSPEVYPGLVPIGAATDGRGAGGMNLHEHHTNAALVGLVDL